MWTYQNHFGHAKKSDRRDNVSNTLGPNVLEAATVTPNQRMVDDVLMRARYVRGSMEIIIMGLRDGDIVNAATAIDLLAKSREDCQKMIMQIDRIETRKRLGLEYLPQPPPDELPDAIP